jgi:lysophospholipase L1-like esterase
MATSTILCLGDSHTRGFYGSDWVSMLQRELGQGTTLVRRGVDGQLARNIAARTARGVADANATAPLSSVILFCGTNDTLAASSTDWQTLHERTTKFIEPGAPRCSPDTFEASVRKALIEIAAANKNAALLPVALVTLPPLDEHDLAGAPINALVREHNARLVKLAAEDPGSVTLIDLYALLERALQSDPPPPARRAAPPLPATESHAPKQMVRKGMVALARRWLLRQKWDKIADADGGRYLTDRIHLSDRAGSVLAAAVKPWAVQVVEQAARTARE